MKRYLTAMCLVVASAAVSAQSSAQQQADAAASNAGVRNGDDVQSTANTWVFPAPVQPGLVVAAKCMNSGVASRALLFNFVSWSDPVHEVSLGCQVAADLDMLVRYCQFATAAKLQAHYMLTQYKITATPVAGVRDLTPDECFKPIAVAPPSAGRAPAPAAAASAPVPPTAASAPQPPAAASAPTPAPVASAPVAPPVAAAPAPREPFAVTVLFAFDKAVLDANARSALDVAARYARNVPGVRLVLTIGHADKIGSTGYNDSLSRRRAEAVGAYLLAAGVPPAVMRVQYRGSSEPVSSRHEDNRRATVAVVE